MSDPTPESSLATSPRSALPLRHVLPFIRPYWKLVLGWLLFLLLSSAATLTLPLAIREMIDHGFSAVNASSINGYFLALFGVATVLSFATAFRFYFATLLGESVVADLRRALYAHLLSLDAAFFERSRTGALLSRLTADAELIQTVVGSSASMALRNAVMFVGAAVMLFLTSPKLTGIAALVIPLTILPIVLFGQRVRKLSRESQDRLADASAQAAESLNAIQTLQANTREREEVRRFDQAIARNLLTARQRISARAILTLLVIFCIFGAITGVLWVGARDVINQTMTTGELSQFVLYAVTAAGAVGTLTDVWGDVLRASGAMDRIGELLAIQPTIRNPPQALALPQPLRGKVVFDQVDFHYPTRPDHAALAAFSLVIEPGETIALVGPSGAGKSTVFQLLLRFYEPQRGCISIDGTDITQVTLDDLRLAIALVPQDSAIFGTNAMENIRIGRTAASDADVIKAARAAEAHDFIERQPDAYYTDLGEHGVRLSGGQQQRIAIARALLRDAPILLLDEATSALDAHNEAAIQKALERVMQQRTTIVIAHRLATVQKVDRIVVMENGRIQAIGTHDQLVAAGGLYAELARLQFVV